MIHITADVRNDVIAHALREQPLEACGMITGRKGEALIDAFHPMVNTAASPTRFVIDPAAMLALEQSLDGTARAITGVMHSHLASSPYPSRTDIDDSTAYDPDGSYVQLMVSLRQPEPAVRAFRIVDGVVTELRVEVFEPDPTAHDQAGAMAKVARLPRPAPPAD